MKINSINNVSLKNTHLLFGSNTPREQDLCVGDPDDFWAKISKGAEILADSPFAEFFKIKPLKNLSEEERERLIELGCKCKSKGISNLSEEEGIEYIRLIRKANPELDRIG